MATQIIGRQVLDSSVDKEGYVEYRVKYLIKGDKTDGPRNARMTSGLPLPGSYWSYDSDVDTSAYRHIQD